jgi:hypothetical protein
MTDSNWTLRFPRTTRCDGHAIYHYRTPLPKRFFYAFVRHGWIAIVVAITLLVLTGCSADMGHEQAQAREMEAVQQDEAAQASREFAGQAVCGPAALAQWEGDVLLCIPKRGKSYQVAGATK